MGNGLTQAIFALWFCASSALATNYAKVTPRQLAHAIAENRLESAPYLHGKISPADIRIIRCAGPDEEPTEFRCTWQQRTGAGWVKRETWLAIDGEGWHINE